MPIPFIDKLAYHFRFQIWVVHCIATEHVTCIGGMGMARCGGRETVVQGVTQMRENTM